MGKEAITQKILADAESEAEVILNEAKKKAGEITQNAEKSAEERYRQVKAETEAKAKEIAERRAAAARLEAAKITLSQKRRVIDEVYNSALKGLYALDSKQSLALVERLLRLYAEKGDEVVFAENYPFYKEASKLPVIQELGLKVCAKRAEIEGGFILKGKISDKNLTFEALLSADREVYQAEIAKKLF